MFRYERPQKGRLREFHQFGCESFGEASVYEDAMIIMMIDEILSTLGIGYKLQLNSLGCNDCMPTYKTSLVQELESFKDNLCSDCNTRISTNPLRVLDCKNESCQELLKNTPKITDNLCSECDSEFAKLKKILDENDISYSIDPMLVRGLDYYCKTAFEFVSDDIGSQSAIAGGGRYDKLVEFLGGKSTPAVGFAMGIERLLELIKMPNSSEDIIYLGAMSKEAVSKIFQIGSLKRKDTKTIIEYKPRSFSKQLNNAGKQNASIVALIGEDELANGTIWIKDLNSKEEKTVRVEEFTVAEVVIKED
jgi:histidyl-tRNA synthetase